MPAGRASRQQGSLTLLKHLSYFLAASRSMLRVVIPSVIDERSLSVFVSWAHSAHGWSKARIESWKKTVFEFTDSLREYGVDAEVDLYYDNANVDWTRFGPQKIADSDVTIIAVSSAWRERWEGRNPANVGAGAAAEADELLGLFQRDQVHFQSTVKIAILPGASEEDIPNNLHRLPRYHISTFDRDGLEELLRALLKKPRYVPRPPGVPPGLPPLNVISDFSGGTGTSAPASDGLAQPSKPARQEELGAYRAQAEDTAWAIPASSSGGGLPWYHAWETAQVPKSLLQVCTMLAGAAPHEVAEARILQSKEMYRAAHAVLTGAVDRLRIDQPQDIHEIIGNLRQTADTQREKKLAELDEVVGRAVTTVADAGNQILEELINEVSSVVKPLSPQMEIRVLISRKQLEAIYHDLASRAAERLTTMFQQRFEERIAPEVITALRTIPALPRQFQKELDKHLIDEAPDAVQDTPAAWGNIASIPLKELLSATGARLVDLQETEQELLIYSFDEAVERITNKGAFNSVFGVLLSAVLKLLWAMFRDDPLSTISKERRVEVVKRRLVTSLQQALEGDDVRSTVGVASLNIETQLHRQAELVRSYMEGVTSTIGSADFVRWFLQHRSTVHEILDRATVLLQQIGARL
jgi:SEFIR domain